MKSETTLPGVPSEATQAQVSTNANVSTWQIPGIMQLQQQHLFFPSAAMMDPAQLLQHQQQEAPHAAQSPQQTLATQAAAQQEAFNSAQQQQPQQQMAANQVTAQQQPSNAAQQQQQQMLQNQEAANQMFASFMQQAGGADVPSIAAVAAFFQQQQQQHVTMVDTTATNVVLPYPTYVNAKQYHRILKRRETRAALEEVFRKARVNQKKSYMHESRHRHAMKRPRGKNGKFLNKEELVVYYKENPDHDPANVAQTNVDAYSATSEEVGKPKAKRAKVGFAVATSSDVSSTE